MGKANTTNYFYITTPIFYPSGEWHYGHCYSAVICDCITRFKRFHQIKTFFGTGTDEHGKKIDTASKIANKNTLEYIDEKVNNLKKLFEMLNIKYDSFLRTTSAFHEKTVQTIFERLYAQGDIYKGVYKGFYCKACESYFVKVDDNKCPDCNRIVSEEEEESYFFKLSRYQDAVLNALKQKDFLLPKERRNEMINFVKSGLRDVSISRANFDWGIKVPIDHAHVIYVWFDALINYLSALSYDGNKFLDNKKAKTTAKESENFFANCTHIMSKEIVRFHSVFFIAILKALKLPLPKQIISHGWLLFEGDKMSKSKNNAVSPIALLNCIKEKTNATNTKIGSDALRLFLLGEIPFCADYAYDDMLIIKAYNKYLANDYGNLINRTYTMCFKYYNGHIEKPKSLSKEIDELIRKTIEKYNDNMNTFHTQKAIESIFELIAFANKYIDEQKPWLSDKCGFLLYNLCEIIRIASILLLPIICDGASRALDSMNYKFLGNLDNLKYGEQERYDLKKIPPLYKRIDIEKNSNIGVNDMQETTKNTKLSENVIQNAKLSENVMQDTKPSEKDFIDIDDFSKIKLKVGEIIACEKIEKADKLLKLCVKIGGEERVIVSGIAKHYSCEQLIHKKVVVVENLKPIKLRGVESHGMLLCASDENKVVLVSPEQDIQSGCEVR